MGEGELLKYDNSSLIDFLLDNYILYIAIHLLHTTAKIVINGMAKIQHTFTWRKGPNIWSKMIDGTSTLQPT